MKSKIKIMNAKPEITDEEIRSFMNFNQLLTQKNNASVNNNKRNLRNAGFGIIGCVILSAVWFFLLPKEDTTEQQPSSHTAAPIIGENPSPIADIKPDSISDQPISDSNKKKTEVAEKKQMVKPGIEQPSLDPSDLKTDTQLAIPPTVYIQAEPKDGYPALYAYFNKELTYPTEALSDSIQGVVMVVFTINTEGRPEKISIEQSLGNVFDREAVRVIQNMPGWKPATYNNKPVDTRISVPLTFQIKKLSAKE